MTISFDGERVVAGGDREAAWGGGLTEADAEALAILRTLRDSSGGEGLMHESFWVTNSSRFTRSWFAMANSMFGEAILRLSEQRPSLLFKD